MSSYADQVRKNRKAWCAALRSREYRQCTGALRDIVHDHLGPFVGYCCLGVACDAHDPKGWEPLEAKTHWDVSVFYGDDDNHMPPRVAKVYGIDMEEAARLTRLNDGGYTFEEIANYIESLPIPDTPPVWPTVY